MCDPIAAYEASSQNKVLYRPLNCRSREPDDVQIIQPSPESKEASQHDDGLLRSQPGKRISLKADENVTVATKRNICYDVQKLMWGVLVVGGIATSWVGSTQLAKETYEPGFKAPLFLVWFSTGWMVLCYPVYLACFLSYQAVRRPPQRLSSSEIFRDSLLVYGVNGLTPSSFLWRCLSFTTLWILSNVMYMMALGVPGIAAADVTALFASNCGFVYLLSWVILKDKFVSLRVVAAVLSISGIIHFAYADGFGSFEFVGVLLVVGASLFSAIYQMLAVALTIAGVVLFSAFNSSPPWLGYVLAIVSALISAVYQVCLKFVFTSSGGGLPQTALFLSLLGSCNLVVAAPLVIASRALHVETFDLTAMPWTYILSMSALLLVFNFLVNFGIVITFPLFIALGVFVGVPLNAVADSVFRGVVFEPLKIAGAVLIMLGFLLVLTPSDWSERVGKLCPCIQIKSQYISEEEKQESTSVRGLLKAGQGVSCTKV